MRSNKDREIGRLFEVHGSFAKAYLTYGAKDNLQFKDKFIEKVGHVGQHVIIPSGFNKIVGRISKIKTEDPFFKLGEKTRLPSFPNFIKIIEITLIGTIYYKKNKSYFEKGLKGYPSADDIVYSINKEELSLLFLGESGRDSLEVGSLIEDEDEKVNMDTERLFQNHFALLGSTGSGKTCTLIHLIQNVLEKEEYKSCHFLVLDPHGEYGKAFDCEEYANDVLHRKIGDNPRNFNHIQSERIDLPHYFFCFSEYKALFRPAPQVQEPTLRRAIGEVRKEANKGESEQEDEIIADKPWKFEIKDLYKKIFDKKSQKEFLGSLGYRIKVTSGLPELKFVFNPQYEPLEFKEYRNILLGFDKKDKFHKVTIIDLSSIPRIKNLLVIITNFLGRCIYEFMRKWEDRGTKHCSIVLEEAHNYVPREFSLLDKSSEHDYTLNTYETISKEGRKYGLCIAMSSQRPRDLSETLLSQCGTYFIHRLNNQYDKNIIQSAASEVDMSMIDKMPVLAKQSCIVMGDAIKSSAEIKVVSLKHEPDSASAKISKLWRKEPSLPMNLEENEEKEEEILEEIDDDFFESEDDSDDDVPF